MANLATINDNILADSGIDPINLIVGTGTVNYIPKFTAEGSIGNSIMTESGANILISSNIVLHAGNFNSYAPTLTGGGASGTWGINISGNAAYATSAGNADTVDGLHASAFALTGGSNATGTWPISVTGTSGYANSAGTAGLVTGTSGGAIQAWDIRTIAPSNMTAGRLGFGFTSWANNNTAPWADYLHLRSYTDASGGNDNLVMFLKSGIGMRIYQQSWGTSAPYTAYADVLHSLNYNSYAPTLTGGGASGTWGISITGNADTLDGYHASAFALASSLSNYLPLAGGNMTGSIGMGGGTNIAFTGGSHAIYGNNTGYLHFYGYTSVYYDNLIVARGGITNDTGDVTISDSLAVDGNIYFLNSGRYLNVGQQNKIVFSYQTLSTVDAGQDRGGWMWNAYYDWNASAYKFMNSNGQGASMLRITNDVLYYHIKNGPATSDTPFNWDAQYVVLHSGNYNSYAPTLTGGGASGTWGINITGNAATVTNGVYTSRTLTINGVTYDLSANRSWTIASGVTSIIAGTGISVDQAQGDVRISNTGVLSVNGSAGDITGIATTAQLAGYLPLAGGTMSGSIAMGGNNITNVSQLAHANGRIILSGNLHIDSFNGYAIYLQYYNQGVTTYVYGAMNFMGYDITNLNVGYANNSFRAPIFYDSNDTSFYVDPNSLSNLYTLRVGNGAEVPGLIGMGAGFLYGMGVSGAYTAVHAHPSANGVALGSYDGGTFTRKFYVNNDGNAYAITGMYAPIFYDSNNTSYYLDPNGTSNLLTVTILNTYVGNAIYFGGGNNYLNWDGARITSNRGIQSEVDMRAPIFYDSNDTNYYGNFASISRFNITQINAVADQSFARLVNPEGGYSVNNSPLSAAIKIKIPPAASYQNTMLSFTVKIYNYQTGTSRTIYIGGYTYYNQDWYNIFAYQVGDVGGDLAVRFGKDGTGNCVWIGETSTYWSYPNVFVTDVQSGHSQPTNMASGWSVSFVTSFDTVQDSRVAYYQINAGNIASQSVSYAASAGNADTLDGYHASYFVPTARTLTINGVTYDLSANRSWTIASGGVNSIIAGTGIAVDQPQGDVRVSNTGVLTVNGSAGDITGIATTAQLAGYLPLTGGTLSGALTINGIWQTNISTTGGWSKLSFVASNAWGDGITYGTLGASGGNEPGVMVYNMHATWAGSGNGAGIRMGRSGGVASGAWYQVATMDSNEFMIAKNGSWGNGGIKITDAGVLYYGNTGYRYIWESGTWGINISGNAVNLYGGGGSSIRSSSVGTSYTANYQVRENDGGYGNTDINYAPQLAFHWGNVVASSILMESSGRISIRNNPGTGYEDLIANIVYGAASVRAPIFYDSQDTGYYLDPNSSSNLYAVVARSYQGNGNIDGTGSASYHPSGFYSTATSWLYGTLYMAGNNMRSIGGIVQNDIMGRPNLQWGAGGSSTGAVIIKFPGNTGNYGMVHAVIDIYEYNGNNVSTVIVGGHNWGSQWYSYGANVVGYTNKQVRVGVKDGKYCIIIGDGSSSWSYGQVVLRKIQNGSYYSGVMDVGAGYTIGIESDSYSWVSGDLRTFRSSGSMYMNEQLVATQAWVSSQGYVTGGPFLPLSGGTVTGTTNFTSSVNMQATSWFGGYGPGYGAGIALENISSFARFAFWGLDFYDWNYGVTMTIDNGYVSSPYSFRAPIFYDSNDTSYYLDPNSGSNLYSVVTVETKARKNQSDNNYTTAALWTESYGGTTTGIAFHISGVLGKFLEMRTNGVLYWANDQVVTNNGGTWGINISGNAATATTASNANAVGGVDISRIVYGGNETKTSYFGDPNDVYASGFYNNYTGTNMPYTSWWHMIVNRHTNPNNSYQLQIAGEFWDNNMYFRKVRGSSGDVSPWARVLNTLNDVYAANMNQYVRTTDAPTFFGTLSISADNGADYTGSRIWLYNHSSYRGAGVYMSLNGGNSTWYAGSPYTDFSGYYMIGYVASTGNSSAADPGNRKWQVSPSGNTYQTGSITAAGGSMTGAFVSNATSQNFTNFTARNTTSAGSMPNHLFYYIEARYNSGSNGTNVYHWVRDTWEYNITNNYSDITFGATYSGSTYSALLRVSADGNIYATNSFRAPIFYDSSDTTYYADLNGGSYMRGLVQVTGGHYNSSIRVLLRADENGAGEGQVTLNMWCSEPGVTWSWAGFGYNVQNDGGSPGGFGRINGNFGQAYMRFSTSGQLRFYNTNTSGTRVETAIFAENGAVTFNYGVYAPAYYESSDARLKTIVDENYRVDAIVSIKPKFYQKNGKFETGYIAQEVDGVYSHAVALGIDGYLNLSYTQVHTLKIAALEDSVDDIKKKIKELEEKLNTLY